MSEFQVITGVASLVGFVATILNLVAFFHEKDKSHIRSGLRVLAGVAVLLAVILFPRFAPGSARQLASKLPGPARTLLNPWLDSSPTPLPAATAPEANPLQGSFTLDLRRNLLGGVDSLIARFQFSNLTPESARVTAYQVRYVDQAGQLRHSFYRVLNPPIQVEGHSQASQDTEFDAEIRDVWVAGLDHEAGQRDKVEITWEGTDAQGRRFKVTSSNG
ncbi:hypothetical protein IV102_27090 [bacterium]|nr:hypothetical protein [bacterium]